MRFQQVLFTGKLIAVFAVATTICSAQQSPAPAISDNTSQNPPATPASTSDTRSATPMQKPPANAQVATERFAERNPRYRIRSGDSFDLDFRFQPEFNQTLSVQPDGFVTLRDIGDLHVQGLTIPELSAALRKAYDQILNDPVITVVLKDFEKPYFIAGGDGIQRPGKFELRSDMTASEAVQIAGGFRSGAKSSEVYIFRRVSDDTYQVKKLNVKKMLSKGDLHEDVHLIPGDMLYVPRSTLAKIASFLPKSTVGTYLNPTQF
jgi:protein involved in polysaccharide export with SLBB domain